MNVLLRFSSSSSTSCSSATTRWTRMVSSKRRGGRGFSSYQRKRVLCFFRVLFSLLVMDTISFATATGISSSSPSLNIETAADSATNMDTTRTNFWIIWALVAFLFASPIIPPLLSWWSRGGRILCVPCRRHDNRNDNGRQIILGIFQYAPPIVNNNNGDGGSPRSMTRNCLLTKEDVLALPEIAYKSPDKNMNSDSDDSSGCSTAGEESSSNEMDAEEEEELPAGEGIDIAITVADGLDVDNTDVAADRCRKEHSLGNNKDLENGLVEEQEEDPSNNNEKPVVAGLHVNNNTKMVMCGSTFSTSCSICLNEFTDGEMVRLLPQCNHAFHTECILPWFVEHRGECPLCNTKVIDIVDGDGEDEEEEQSRRDAEEQENV